MSPAPGAQAGGLPDAQYNLPGAEFLVERYRAAAAVPPEQRSHCVATFVRTYEALRDVVATLPLVHVRGCSPPRRRAPPARLACKGSTSLLCFMAFHSPKLYA